MTRSTSHNPFTGQSGPGPAASAVARQRILVVDDDPLQLKSQQLQLEHAGFQVELATSAREALETARRTRPDLVLSDVLMPETDGFKLCRALRKDPSTRPVPVVLVSGHYGERKDLRHAAHCGANMFVSRSSGPAGIVRQVRSALAHPAIRLEPADEPVLNAEHAGRVGEQLQVTEQKYRAIFHSIAEGAFVSDGEFRIGDTNPAASQLLGFSADEMRCRPLSAFVSPDYRSSLPALLRQYAEAGHYEGEIPFVHKDGGVRQGRVTGRRVRPNQYVTIVRDVTEQLRNDQKLRALAYTDALTGLANRESFQQRIDQAVAAAVAGGHAAGVLVLALGNFREINDTLGPAGGDQLLREIARRVEAAGFGPAAVHARFGAAQFGVLLPRLDDGQHLERAAQALLDQFSEPMPVDGIPIEVTPHIGSAECPSDAIIGGELLRRASVAVHHACEQNLSWSSYVVQHDPFSLQRLTLVSELRHAIARNELELWYQPKLNLRSGRVDAVEALMRWRHPVRGLVAPDDFIPAAERTGQIHRLTAWALNAALKQARSWHDSGLELNVAVNVSANDLRQPDFVAQVLRAVQASGMPHGSLTLEVTESAAMENILQAGRVLDELRQRGLRISLDDFGTGQASLAHLHGLPVDELKLDKSFVLNLPDQQSLSIARAALILAREFGLKTVAEGMETAASGQLLRELGFDRAQGYHLSKPLPAPELTAWIGRRQSAPVTT